MLQSCSRAVSAHPLSIFRPLMLVRKMSVSAAASSTPTSASSTSVAINRSRVSLGTYQIKGSAAFEVVRAALATGWRRIDTATVYKNEAEVGRAIRESGVPRSEICVTSKLGPSQMGSVEDAYLGVKRSVEAMGMEWIDNYLLHWPGLGGLKPPDERHITARIDAWRGLERACAEGLVKRIGVSNFEVRHLEELEAAKWTIKPYSNQFELHPLLYQTQRPIIDWCSSRGIDVQAYSPLGSGSPKLLYNPDVLQIAKAAHRTPAQVLIRWAFQHGWEVLPKTKTPERLEVNARACASDWELTKDQMAELDQLETKCGTQRFCWSPTTIR
jgi:diketogulonate reductase-like aldo/keto reductase